ncbi:unnamed protein product [Closterium sp. NIES-53]
MVAGRLRAVMRRHLHEESKDGSRQVQGGHAEVVHHAVAVRLARAQAAARPLDRHLAALGLVDAEGGEGEGAGGTGREQEGRGGSGREGPGVESGELLKGRERRGAERLLDRHLAALGLPDAEGGEGERRDGEGCGGTAGDRRGKDGEGGGGTEGEGRGAVEGGLRRGKK